MTPSPPIHGRNDLPALLREVLAGNAFYRAKMVEAGPAAAALGRSSVEAILGSFPLTTKAEIVDDQARHPPFGTNLTYPLERYVRMHQTSGTSTGRPLTWLDTAESWDRVVACWARIWRGVGLLPSDRVFFPFSFGPFLGFWSAFEGAWRSGALCVPGGGMTTLARLRAILDLGVTVVAATPTYALRLAEVARSLGEDLARSAVRALVVAGEPGGSLPGTRERMERAWGARVFDHYGMTEVGPVAYECIEAPGGMHVLEDDYIVEVLDPRTLSPVPEGQEGELVITNLYRAGSPLVRYRTGDVVRWSRRPCACGSPHLRLEGGILARVDDMTFVRGNNVYPAAVEAILRRFTEVGEYRVRVQRRNEMAALTIELEPQATEEGPPPAGADGLAGRVAAAVESSLLFRPEVVVVAPGSLPRFEMKAKRWIKEF